MLLITLLAAQATEINNPGGERIPFIKLRSERWDIVIRKTAETRARVERVKAQCGSTWIDACAPGVEAAVRKYAISKAFQEGVQLSGSFSYCSTAVIRELPANLGRQLVNPDPSDFCAVMEDPEAFRHELPDDAEQGENALVSRLMGGQNTTSGKIKIKPPPKREGVVLSPKPEPLVGPDGTVASVAPGASPAPQPATAPVPSTPPEPTVPAPRAAEPTAPEPTPPEPAPTPAPPVPDAVEPIVAPAPEPVDTTSAAEPAPVPEPAPTASSTPEPEPEPEPAPRKAARPAPAPDPEPAPPPPAPKPPPEPDEFALEEAEMEGMERLSDVVAAEEDEKKKKKKKKKKTKGSKAEPPKPAPVVVGGDEDFDQYIIIDIEALPDE